MRPRATAPAVRPLEWIVTAYGDSALQVTGVADRERAWRAVHDIADAVNSGSVDGLVGAIATYDTVLVEFDPLTLLPAEAEDRLRSVIDGHRAPRSERQRSTFLLPVAYGGDFGPDLEAVAGELRVEPAEVIHRHSALEHVVRCFSHSASAMLDGPAFQREVPRLPDPRLAVPAGSVGLAGTQAIVLARTQASGWLIIGRTPVRIADLAASRLTAYRPGDVFRYRRIEAGQWAQFANMSLEDCRV